MKVKSLHIDSFRHLQNVNFEFTYPEAHFKAGKPLDKICIIGQSATGKTGLLELIKDSLSNLAKIELVNEREIFNHYPLGFKGHIEFLSDKEYLKLEENKITKNDIVYHYTTRSGGGSISNITLHRLRLLYLTTEIISRESVNIFNKNPLDLIGEWSIDKHGRLDENFILDNYFYEFSQNKDQELWFILLKKILDYRKRFTQMASELINTGTIGNLEKLNNQYKIWSKDNENILESFAKKFNPILDRLNLEVDLINTEYLIPIKLKTRDEVIPISSLGTGTKGLLLSMFPLFELDTDDSMILLDEPERSLFPDMQIDLMTHYQNLAPNAQFIVATHSPFIAASFEPYERFILYFNAKGEVAVRQGESPIGDDPNDMLTNDFNVDYYNDFGKKAYSDYRELKRKVAKETEPSKKKELIVELAELGDKYKF